MALLGENEAGRTETLWVAANGAFLRASEESTRWYVDDGATAK